MIQDCVFLIVSGQKKKKISLLWIEEKNIKHRRHYEKQRWKDIRINSRANQAYLGKYVAEWATAFPGRTSRRPKGNGFFSQDRLLPFGQFPDLQVPLNSWWWIQLPTPAAAWWVCAGGRGVDSCHDSVRVMNRKMESVCPPTTTARLANKTPSDISKIPWSREKF